MAQEVVPHVSDVAVRLAVLEERMAGVSIALGLQAKEYERRLIDLNHAHQKQVADQQTYVSLDKFEGFEDKVTGWYNVNMAKMAEIAGREKGSESLKAIGMMIVAAAVAAIVGFISAKLGAAP